MNTPRAPYEGPRRPPSYNSFRPPRPGQGQYGPPPPGYAASPMAFQPQMGIPNPQFPGHMPPMNHPGGPFNNNDQLIMNLIGLLSHQRQNSGMMNSSHNHYPVFHNGGFPPNGPPIPFQNHFPGCNYGHYPNHMSGPPPHMFDPSRAGVHNQSGNPPVLNNHQNAMFSGGSQPNQDQANGMVYPVSNPPPQFIRDASEHENLSGPPKFHQPFHNSGNSFEKGPFSSKRNMWKKDGQRWGNQKNHSHYKDNRKRKFGFNNSRNREDEDAFSKGFEKKRKMMIPNYSEQEIIKWREDRRKNYPSKANLENKSKKLMPSDSIEEEAKQRREQLKDILSKQAELGVEVADIPSHYLGDSEGNKRVFNKRGRNGKFNNRWNKNHSGKPKQQMRRNGGFVKQPSLLQKLLSADIKKEKQQLLQALRFMVNNSFFMNYPEGSLEFPAVEVEDSGWESGKRSVSLEEDCDKRLEDCDKRLEDAEEGEIID